MLQSLLLSMHFYHVEAQLTRLTEEQPTREGEELSPTICRQTIRGLIVSEVICVGYRNAEVNASSN